MKKIIRMACIGLTLLVVGYGSWMAWDKGLLGHNPRAPIAEIMEGAVRRQILVERLGRRDIESCVSIDLENPRPEISGMPGIDFDKLPGSYSVTLLKQVHFRYQPDRDRQLEQLDFLASQGYLSSVDETIITDSGPRLARTYRLTWKGFANMQPNSRGLLCFSCGKRDFAGIEKIEKLLEKVFDLDVYEVTYLSRVVNVPAWASTEEGVRLFPQLRQQTAETRGKVKVIRTRNGWRALYEVQLEATMATRSPFVAKVRMRELEQLERPEPSLDETAELVAMKTVDPGVAPFKSVACLPLHLRPGGDDRTASAAGKGAPFVVTYYDRGDRKPYEYQSMANNLHILAALEGAGLATMKWSESIPPSRGRAGKPAALRYEVMPEVVSALELSSHGGGCIPAGRIEVETLAVHKAPGGNVEVKLRGRIEQTPDWVAKIAERLPALRSLTEGGLPLSGLLTVRSEEAGGGWHLLRLRPSYPKIRYQGIPPHLVSLMPQTAEAFHASLVKAPSERFLAMRKPGRDKASKQSPSIPPESTSLTQSASASNNPRHMASRRVERRASKEPPFPAGGAPVHVISIYEAPLPDGAERGFRQHTEGVVPVTVSEKNVVLLLFAYEPVEWRIRTSGRAIPKWIIASGYYDQRVTLEGSGKPEVVVGKRGELLSRAGVNLHDGVPIRTSENDLVDIAAICRALTGSLPQSFQASYKAPVKGFKVDSATSRFALPAARTPADFDGDGVSLYSPFSDVVEGNRVLRGPAGAFTEAWADRAYSAGKVYFEGRIRVAGALVAHTHANIGLCLANERAMALPPSRQVLLIRHGEQKLYQDGTVFGVAADLDQHQLYYHVNGNWITGPPGSGRGKPLEAGKMYRACFLTAGTTSSEVKGGVEPSDTTWEVNLGEQPFIQKLPPGYYPYQGR